jgi:hypothetical protein
VPADRNAEARLIGVLGILVLVPLVYPALRYAGYLAAPACVLYAMSHGRAHGAVPFIRPFLLVAVLGALFFPVGTLHGLADAFFIISGICIGLVLTRYPISLGRLAVICLVGWPLSLGSRDGDEVMDVLMSQSPLESAFSFLFGLLAVASLLEKRWRLFLLMAVATYLSGKRIAIAGVLVCVLVTWAPRALRLVALNRYVVLAANLLVVLGTILFARGDFDDLVHDRTEASANQISMGRQLILHDVVERIAAEPVRFALVGVGPGEAYDSVDESVAEAMETTRKVNLHSDLLKILFEYGGVVLCAFILLLYSARDERLLILALYTNVLLVSDNTLIYQFYLFYYVLICGSFFVRSPAAFSRPTTRRQCQAL